MGHKSTTVVNEYTKCGTRIIDPFRTREEKLTQRAERMKKARELRKRCGNFVSKPQ